MKKSNLFTTIDEYIAAQPDAVKPGLELFRKTVRKAAPKAEEVISYGMPAYKMNRVLVYFAAAKNHYGFYPTPGPIAAFQKELKDFISSKGAIQFPLDQPIPVKLVTKIVQWRLMEDMEKAKPKKKPPAKK